MAAGAEPVRSTKPPAWRFLAQRRLDVVQTEFGTQFLQIDFQCFCILDLGGVFEQHLVCVVDQTGIQGFPAMQDQVLDGSCGVARHAQCHRGFAISSTLV